MTSPGDLARRSLRAAALGGLALGLLATPGAAAAPTAAPAPPGASATVDTERKAGPATPRLSVRTFQGGLDLPWDLAFLPNGGILYTERENRQVVYRAPSGRRRVVVNAPSHLWSSGETGMMAILPDRDFAESRTFLTCHGSTASGSPDVRVVRWQLSDGFRSARPIRRLVTGLPATTGQHGGCRLRFGSEGALYIGTGDASDHQTPQDLTSGGGKVLRVKPSTGAGWPTNRWSDSSNAMQRRVFTYGHRNVQGLALRADGRMWSVEHGTHRDDEANLLLNGRNYGWNPGPGYDQSGPMTDRSLPGRQIGARWRSGNPTIAPSGATWIRGRQWGAYRGCLALGVLGSEELLILKFDEDGRLVRSFKPAVLDGDAGRLRSVVMGPDNNLYVTTSNFEGDNRILVVTPQR